MIKKINIEVGNTSSWKTQMLARKHKYYFYVDYELYG